MELKFKYIWKHKNTGFITIDVAPLEYIETEKENKFRENDEWELVKRCQFIGLKDMHGIEMFVGDKIIFEACDWVIKFGFHKVSYVEGSGIWDYAYGFYIESGEFLKAVDPIDQNTASQSEVIGSIYS